MRKYQRNRVQITGNPTQQRESEKRERVLEALSSVVAKLGGGNAIPPALQLTSAINPPPGSGFAWLLGGRPGGQLGLGGTGSGQSATIGSNPNRDGKVFFGSAQQTAYDELNERIGIRNPAPLHALDIGTVTTGQIAAIITNAGAGTSDFAEFAAFNTAGGSFSHAIRIMVLGTGWTTIGAFVQDGGILVTDSNLSGGLSLAARHSSGELRLYAGGIATTHERVRLAVDGSILLRGPVKLEDPGVGTNTITLQSPTTPTTHTLTLPAVPIDLGFLRTTAGGVLSWLVLTAASFPHVLLDSAVHTDVTTAGVSRGSLITGQNATPTWAELIHPAAANRALRTTTTDVTWTQGDIDFGTFKAIAMACDSGGTLPLVPANGQWFLHIPTGRTVLLQYRSGTWVPLATFGTMAIFVDAAAASDDQNNGHSAAFPFKTPQFAFDQISGASLGGNVTITFAKGQYPGGAALGGKYPTGAFSITLQGNTTYTGTPETITGHGATGAVNGSATTQDVIGVAAGTPWVVNAYRDKIIRITGTVPTTIDVHRVIESNTTSTITLCGNPIGRAVADTDVITIMPVSSASEASIIGAITDTGISGLTLASTLPVSIPVLVNDFRFDSNHSANISFGNLHILAGQVTVRRCYMNGGRVSVRSANGAAFSSIDTCALVPNKTDSSGIYATNKATQLDIYNCLIRNNGTTGVGINVAGLQTVNVMFGTVISGFTSGVMSGAFSVAGGIVVLHSATRWPFFKNNTVDLVRSKGTRILLNTAASFTTETIAADIEYKKNKTLLDNTLTDLLTCTIANNTVVFVDITYEVEVYNGTDLQITTGQIAYRMYKKGAAAVIGTAIDVPGTVLASAGTLIVAFQPKVGTNNILQVTVTSSLVTDGTSSNSTPKIRYTLNDYTEQGVTLN